MKIGLKAYDALQNNEKLPRKIKKCLLGLKMSKKKLKKLLKSVVLRKDGRHTIIKPYEFCPFCGCKETISTGNMVEYPERYEKIFCARCKKLVCMSDNSPYYHALEFDDFKLD